MLRSRLLIVLGSLITAGSMWYLAGNQGLGTEVFFFATDVGTACTAVRPSGFLLGTLAGLLMTSGTVLAAYGWWLATTEVGLTPVGRGVLAVALVGTLAGLGLIALDFYDAAQRLTQWKAAASAPHQESPESEQPAADAEPQQAEPQQDVPPHRPRRRPQPANQAEPLSGGEDEQSESASCGEDEFADGPMKLDNEPAGFPDHDAMEVRMAIGGLATARLDGNLQRGFQALLLAQAAIALAALVGLRGPAPRQRPTRWLSIALVLGAAAPLAIALSTIVTALGSARRLVVLSGPFVEGTPGDMLFYLEQVLVVGSAAIATPLLLAVMLVAIALAFPRPGALGPATASSPGDTLGE